MKTITVTKMNHVIDDFVNVLQRHMDATGVLGFAIARNYRKVSDEIVEYIDRRNDLITKYGKDEIGKDGKPTGRKYIDANSDNLKKFAEELQKYADIEVSVDVMTVSLDEIGDQLKAKDIVELEMMIDFDD